MSEQELFPKDEGEEEPTDEIEPEVPEADAAEQTRPLAEPAAKRPTDRVGDRPEADALDQDRVEDPAEDDDRR